MGEEGKKPLVSILIPVCNRKNLVCETIENALAQDYDEIEVIVGDNKSTDGTFEMLQERYQGNERMILFQNSSNIGPVANWQACLEHAHGVYIKILWSDDLMSSNFISRAVSWLEKEPKASFAYSAVCIFDDVFKMNVEKKPVYVMGKEGCYRGNRFIYSSIIKRTAPVSPGCAVFRKEKLLIVGDIPNTRNYNHWMSGAGPDVLCYYYALQSGDKFVYIDEIMNYFRRHEGSITVSDNTVGIGYETAQLYYCFSGNHPLLKFWWRITLLRQMQGFDYIYRNKRMYFLKSFCELITPGGILTVFCVLLFDIRSRVKVKFSKKKLL